MRRLGIACLVLAWAAADLDAQLRLRRRANVGVSGAVASPLDGLRASPYWATVGAGTIPARATQCGATVTAYTGTATTINDAIAACTAGQHVLLGAGTFNLSTGVVIKKSEISLRGSGPNTTFVKFTGFYNCDGPSASVCIVPIAGVNYNDGPHNTANWTAGYTRGTTAITLSSTTNLAVDTPIILDQLADSTTDNGQWWESGGDASFGAKACRTDGCARNTNRTLRPQIFYTKVVAINGSVVTLADPLVHENWNGGQSPGAWWQGSIASSPAIINVGIENMSLDYSGLDSNFGIMFGNAYGGWIKNIRSLVTTGSLTSQVRLYQSAHLTIRDSYFYGKQGATGNYGITPYGDSNSLYENNIGECNGTFITDAAASVVFGYNYMLNDCYVNQNWMQAGHYYHSSGNDYVLMEGNDSPGLIQDNIHGPAFFITGFRNRWHGWENGKINQTVAAHIYSQNRYSNLVGNVLGQSGYHTTYETAAGGSVASCALSIFALGLGGNCDNSDGMIMPPNDTLVKATLLRWGNYDVVTATVRWEAGEVPTGDAYYPNAVPSQTLPNSLYLSAAPSWFGAVQWPPIGPEVTGGQEANVGGRVYWIPAKVCHDSLAIDTNYAVSRTVTAGSYAAGLVTLTIGSHSFVAGDSMYISGISPAAYNGTFLIYAVTGTTVQYGLLASPGTYTSGGTVQSPSVRQFTGCAYQ